MALTQTLGLIYLVSEILLTLTRRSRPKPGAKDPDRASLLTVWTVIAIGVMAGVLALQYCPWATFPRHSALTIVSVAIFVAGLIIRWWAIIHLGRFFTVNVSIAPDHQLVDTGPFWFVRHPSYTGVLLAFVGLALTLHNWVAFLAVLVPIFCVFLYRMRIEEEALTEAFGERYRGYMRRTKRLIPKLY